MGIMEKFKNMMPGGGESELSPEEARIAELKNERNGLAEANKGRPESWGVDPRFEQINREIENLTRDIRQKEKKT